MKTHQLTAVSAAVIVTGILVPTRSYAAPSTIPSVPVGILSAYPTVVQTGTKPTLTWSIFYPSKLGDLVSVTPSGKLTTSQMLYVSVQPVGTRVTSSNAVASSTTPAEARLSLNGASYQQLFYGTQADVDPAYSLYIKKLKAGDTVDFGGRYVENGTFSPFYTSYSSNLQVIALVDGATPPTAATTSPQQPATPAPYLAPYLDSTGKVSIGPLSVLIMMELGQTNHGASSFDHQDMVLLVSFNKKHPNNGHGNNLDGVDSSNPGRGSGGPNGAVDPSGGVDDEKR